MQVASTYLEGDAITYYRSLVDRRAATVIAWSEFEQGLKLAFGNINQSAHARAQLQDLRLYGSVEAYYKRFMQPCAEISDMPLSDGDMIFRFMQGLKDELRMQVAMDPLTKKEDKNFTELTNAALAFGAVQERISGGRHVAPRVADTAGRSQRYAQPTDHSRDRPVEAMYRMTGGSMPSNRKRPHAEAPNPTKRRRGPTDIYLTNQDRALITFPDAKKGEKPTGVCCFNNCQGMHGWQECPRADNQAILARGRDNARKGKAASQD